MTTMRSIATVVASVALLGACVTINVYFPAAAAERAADRIIEEVWGDGVEKSAAEQSSEAGNFTGGLVDYATRSSRLIVDWLIPAAQAQQAKLDITSPAIGKIEASMRARHAKLLRHYNTGAIGLTDNGLVAVRDAKAVPLSDRKTVKQLVANDNRDRVALYREIAAANGHPEWETQIRSTFARRWVDLAQHGWYYQTGGNWKAK